VLASAVDRHQPPQADLVQQNEGVVIEGGHGPIV
jgi:hypothetical protein